MASVIRYADGAAGSYQSDGKQKGKMSKPAPKPITIEAGDTLRIQCDGCLSEFEICYEPKVHDAGADPAAFEPKEILSCPFCASHRLDEL